MNEVVQEGQIDVCEEGAAPLCPHQTQFPSPSPWPQNLGKLMPPIHWRIGNRVPIWWCLEGKKGKKKKSQTAETVTKITTRNVNKILLQAAHSPPHAQQLPPPQQKVKTYKVCVLKKCGAALWEEAMRMKFSLRLAHFDNHGAWDVLLKEHWACLLI